MTPTARTAPPEVFFCFPDRTLMFNCPECGFLCCQGFGMGFQQKEFVPLFKTHPALRLFTYNNRDSQMLECNTLPPGCWFLGDDGKCRVHVEQGRDRKPTLCKLFPANRFLYLLDNVFIVGVNLLCPLRVAGDGAGDLLDHADIRADIANVEDIHALKKEAPQLRALSPYLKDFLAVEGLVRDRSVDYLDRGYIEFAAFQSVVAERYARREDVAAPVTEAEMGVAREAFRPLIVAWEELLDVPSVALGDRRVDRLMAAITPHIRAMFILHRPGAGYRGALAALPRLLLALDYYGHLSLRIGPTALSLKSIEMMFNNLYPVLVFMAHALDTPYLTTDEMKLNLAEAKKSGMSAFLHAICDQRARRPENRTVAQIINGELGLTDVEKISFMRSCSQLVDAIGFY